MRARTAFGAILIASLGLTLVKQASSSPRVCVAKDGTTFTAARRGPSPLPLPAGKAPGLHIATTPMWQTAEDLSVGGMALGDANNDGRLDLAAVTYSGGYPPTPTENRIYVNQGTAFETQPSWISTDSDWSTGASWSFITQKETPDLVVVNGGGSGNVTIYGHGPSGVATSPTWSADSPKGSSLGVAVGDVNGDGTPDIFLSNQCYSPCPGAPNVGFLSSGGTLPTQANWQSADEGQFSGIALGDPDRSGVESKVHAVPGTGKALYWIPGAPLFGLQRVLVNGQNPGKVTYDLESGYVLFAQAPAAGATVQFLYETSNQLDVAASANPGNVEIYQHSGTSLSTSPSWTSNTGEYGYKALLFIDLNLDGYPELFASGASDTPAVVFANHNGTLDTTPSWSSAIQDFSGEDVSEVDANGDGYPDVLAVSFTGGVRLYLNQGGTLETTPSLQRPYDGNSIASCAAGDINGDGMPEIIIGYAGDKTKAYLNQGTALAAPQASDAQPSTVAASGTLTITGTNFQGPVRVYLGDTLLGQYTPTGNSIAATVPASMASGTYDLVVVNPDLQASVRAQSVTVQGDSDAGTPEASTPEASTPEGGSDASADSAPEASVDSGADAGKDSGADGAVPIQDAGKDGAVNPSQAETSDDSGCSCRTAGSSKGPMGASLLGLGLLAGLMGLRRRGARG